MKTIDKIMIVLFIIGVTILGFKANAQTFIEGPVDNYWGIQFEIDPLGSLDKEGINTVFTGVLKPLKKLPIEIGLGIQTIFTTKYVDKYEREQQGDVMKLDYIDAQIQAQYLVDITDRFQLLGGIHGGWVERQFGGGMVSGVIGTARWFISKSQKWAITISGAMDRRQDINDWQFNGRGGITRIFNL